ncbi:hypothetical protein FZEAL_6889 [Fusarium zealandicum]|uniref:Uncharacterized protein n=1 Tax=Fusarium zealandicum TaxID=1053134 RepID=A0A8H4UH45_9HYPO|nr:hypothetical protein FZEAL_6889 [Fusarium zealandicum]
MRDYSNQAESSECTPRLVALEAQDDAVYQRLETSDPDELEAYFKVCRKNKKKKNNRKMVYIIEGTNPEFVAALGGQFRMHPSFFSDYLVVAHMSTENQSIDNILPSIACSRDHLCLEYYEFLKWPDTYNDDVEVSDCLHTGRGANRDKDLSTLSFNRKCSVWSSSKSSDGGWDAVVLCDPPPRIRIKATGMLVDDFEPWSGGYSDFLPYKYQMECLSGPPRTSMLDDLRYYLQQHSRHLDLDEADAPLLFIQKIIAQQYAQGLEVSRTTVLNAQLDLSGFQDLSSFESDNVELKWSNGQTHESSLMFDYENLRQIMIQLGIPTSPGSRNDTKDWKDTASDFQTLLTQAEEVLQQMRSCNSAITGLASIVNANQAVKAQRLALEAAKLSAKEAKRARALVLLGLVFVPLSLISSIFSMSEPYSVGHSRFWVYFAVSVPVAIVTVATYFVYDTELFSEVSRLIVEKMRERWKNWLKINDVSTKSSEEDFS